MHHRHWNTSNFGFPNRNRPARHTATIPYNNLGRTPWLCRLLFRHLDTDDDLFPYHRCNNRPRLQNNRHRMCFSDSIRHRRLLWQSPCNFPNKQRCFHCNSMFAFLCRELRHRSVTVLYSTPKQMMNRHPTCHRPGMVQYQTDRN